MISLLIVVRTDGRIWSGGAWKEDGSVCAYLKTYADIFEQQNLGKHTGFWSWEEVSAPPESVVLNTIVARIGDSAYKAHTHDLTRAAALRGEL
jgi:hypothetical protein